MRRKFEFLFPNIHSARLAEKEMHLACIDDKHMYFLARPDTDLGELHPGNVFERTDMLQECKRGIAVGAGLGLLAGMLALMFPPWYSHTSWAVILATTAVFGAVFGTIGMALLGVNLANSDWDSLKARMARGEILMVISMPLQRVKELRLILSSFASPPLVGLKD